MYFYPSLFGCLYNILYICIVFRITERLSIFIIYFFNMKNDIFFKVHLIGQSEKKKLVITNLSDRDVTNVKIESNDICSIFDSLQKIIHSGETISVNTYHIIQDPKSPIITISWDSISARKSITIKVESL